jgi:hypothetical protein
MTLDMQAALCDSFNSLFAAWRRVKKRGELEQWQERVKAAGEWEGTQKSAAEFDAYFFIFPYLLDVVEKYELGEYESEEDAFAAWMDVWGEAIKALEVHLKESGGGHELKGQA